MHVCRVYDKMHGGLHVAIRLPDDQVFILAGPTSIGALLRLRREQLRDLIGGPLGGARPAVDFVFLPPADGRMEVWGAGVTYQRSRDARMEESQTEDIYERVYRADRPELFFKAVPWRTVTDGERIGLRADSENDVPEPELAIVVNAHEEIVGYTICNDVTSRSIEGTNPLYLPQAKLFAGGCSLGPGFVPNWEVADPYDLEIHLTVERGRALVIDETAHTKHLNRRLEELVDHLHRGSDFPDGVVLSTGAGVVPDLDFSLREGDVVRISITDVGVLENVVASATSCAEWTSRAWTNPELRAVPVESQGALAN